MCRLCSFVGCGVIGAALAVLLVSVCFWLAVRVGGVICCGGGVLVGSSTGPGRHRSAPIRPAIRCSGQAAGPAAGRWAKEKGQGRRRGVRCCSGLWSALAAMVPAGCVPVQEVGAIPGYSAHFTRGGRAAPDPLHRFRLQRFRLVVLHPGRFWPFAGGVRFST